MCLFVCIRCLCLCVVACALACSNAQLLRCCSLLRTRTDTRARTHTHTHARTHTHTHTHTHARTHARTFAHTHARAQVHSGRVREALEQRRRCVLLVRLFVWWFLRRSSLHAFCLESRRHVTVFRPYTEKGSFEREWDRRYRVVNASLPRRYSIGSKLRHGTGPAWHGVDELERNTPQAFSRGTQGYSWGYSGVLSRVPTGVLGISFTGTDGVPTGVLRSAHGQA